MNYKIDVLKSDIIENMFFYHHDLKNFQTDGMYGTFLPLNSNNEYVLYLTYSNITSSKFPITVDDFIKEDEIDYNKKVDNLLKQITETKKEDDKFIYIYNDDVKLSLLFFDNLIKYYNCVKISVEDCWKLDNFTISNSIIIVSFYDNELQGTHYNNLKKFIKEQSISNKFIVVFDDMSLDVYDENGKSFHEILLDFKILK